MTQQLPICRVLCTSLCSMQNVLFKIFRIHCATVMQNFLRKEIRERKCIVIVMSLNICAYMTCAPIAHVYININFISQSPRENVKSLRKI